MNNRKSIISRLGFSEVVGSVPFLLTLILALTPYLANTDFGIFKVPDLDAQSKKTLKWLGPALFIGSWLLYVPLLKTKVFSIDHPHNNEKIPLGDDQTWILDGKFPTLAEDQDIEGSPVVTIEVYKMPERKLVYQGKETRKISTIRGSWHHQSVKFDGPGEYEINVEAALDGLRDFCSINVRCLQKAEAYRQTIIKDREYRNAPSLVLADPQKISLPSLYQDLYQLQNQFFEFYPQDLDSASQVVIKTLDMLDPVLPSFPNDIYLQNIRAYTLKNHAMIMRDLKRPEEFDRLLKESEKMLEAIRQQNPEDASAWNGLGSIALLRNDPKTALRYIEEALEIMPNYEAAIHDRETALRMLQEQES